MSKTKLTRKKEKFVEAFVQTGVKAEAARQAFDIDPENKGLAASMGHEYMTKPDIQAAILERITPDMVEDAHRSLLTAVRLDYFTFGHQMEDEEIVAHMESVGLVCANIRWTDKGKMAFYSIPDGAARGKGIELYHKVMGTFAPEKKLTVNVDATVPDPRIVELANKLNN